MLARTTRALSLALVLGALHACASEPAPGFVADAASDAPGVCTFEVRSVSIDCSVACTNYRAWATTNGCASEALRALDAQQCASECADARNRSEDVVANWGCFERTATCRGWEDCYASCRTGR
jgi:hypothetical protein